MDGLRVKIGHYIMGAWAEIKQNRIRGVIKIIGCHLRLIPNLIQDLWSNLLFTIRYGLAICFFWALLHAAKIWNYIWNMYFLFVTPFKKSVNLKIENVLLWHQCASIFNFKNDILLFIKNKNQETTRLKMISIFKAAQKCKMGTYL